MLIAGVDEVGRGCLFGPVVAAAVILPEAKIPQLKKLGVKDSKQLSPKQRNELVPQIKALVLDDKIASASVEEIEQINILQASLLAMKRAVVSLKMTPAVCQVDGRQAIPDLSIPQHNIVRGDRQSPIIAAASIIAKVWRDALICQIASEYPQYDLASNKGYGTRRHLQALKQFGPTPMHRLSFRPCKDLLPYNR